MSAVITLQPRSGGRGRPAPRHVFTELISTSTPVAYAPPWASTLASKTQVTRKATRVKTMTIGRTARAQCGAMP